MAGRKKIALAVLVLLLLGSLIGGSWIWLRPAPLRLLSLLPAGANLYLKADLVGLRSNHALARLMARREELPTSPAYRDFVEATGFRYQQHLRGIAAAKIGEDWVGAAQIVLDRSRTVNYLESAGAEQYELEGLTVYSYGNSRPFRLVFLDEERVAFSAGVDRTLLADLISRYRGRSSGFLPPMSSTEAEQVGPDAEQDGGERTDDPHESEIWAFVDMERLVGQIPETPLFGPFSMGRDILRGSRKLTLRVEASPLDLRAEIRNRVEDRESADRLANGLRAILVILRASVSASERSEGREEGWNYGPVFAAVEIARRRESVIVRWQWNASMLGLLREPGQ
jgi:hypothetical protein